MRVAVFSTKPYDRSSFTEANERFGHDLVFLEPRLKPETAQLADGFEGICAFVNDALSGEVLESLAAGGVRLVALRSAGFNHVDLGAAAGLGITVARVPAYSPHAVAEHAVALILTLDRKIYRSYLRVREGNFSLEGLLGFDLHGKAVGIVGTGAIGSVFARIMIGFGCRVLAFDPTPNDECVALGVEYVAFDDLLIGSDIVALHAPLLDSTFHLIDDRALRLMKDGAMLVNTSRGALVNTRAVIAALKSGKLGSLALDVYEEEAGLFFADRSQQVIQDDVFSRLLTFPNVVITGHQAFFTAEALARIADTTLSNVTAFETGEGTLHRVTPPG